MKNSIRITTISATFLSLFLITNAQAQSNINRLRETEGKNITGTIVRAEQAYHFERQEFTNSIKKLGLSFPSQYYKPTFSMVTKNKIIIKTIPNMNTLKSYTGGISYSNSEGSYSMIICESISANTKINNPILTGNSWSCGSGFVEIQ